MTITPQQTEKLLRGNYSFSQLGFSMMVTRLKSVYSKDPSPTVLDKSASEINTFFDKFKSVLANDFAIIAKL